jgi:hypothetical protein
VRVIVTPSRYRTKTMRGAKSFRRGKEVERSNTSIADPDPNLDADPPDPRPSAPPGSCSGSLYHHANIVRKTLITPILGLSS